MRVFPITPYPWRAFVVLLALTLGLPLAVVALALAFSAALASWVLVFALALAIGFMLSVNVALTALALYVTTRNEVTIRGGTMHLKGGEFHERVPLDSVIGAEVVTTAARHDIRRARRRNGIVLPGFRVGWFETESGRWLFVLRASGKRALYIDTDINFDVLLGVADPERLRGHLLSNRTEDRD